MEAAMSSETSVSYYNITCCHNREDLDFNIHRRENLKSLITLNYLRTKRGKCLDKAQGVRMSFGWRWYQRCGSLSFCYRKVTWLVWSAFCFTTVLEIKD